MIENLFHTRPFGVSRCCQLLFAAGLGGNA